MPTARHGLAAVAIEDKICVVGGGPEPGLSVINVNEIFHVSSCKNFKILMCFSVGLNLFTACDRVSHTLKLF